MSAYTETKTKQATVIWIRLLEMQWNEHINFVTTQPHTFLVYSLWLKSQKLQYKFTAPLNILTLTKFIITRFTPYWREERAQCDWDYSRILISKTGIPQTLYALCIYKLSVRSTGQNNNTLCWWLLFMTSAHLSVHEPITTDENYLFLCCDGLLFANKY